MLSKLVEIAKRDDIQEITGLTTKQMQLLFFLLFSSEDEFSFGQLRKQLDRVLKISFNEKTLSRSLGKLEEKQVITWVRADKFQRARDPRTISQLPHLLTLTKRLPIRRTHRR